MVLGAGSRYLFPRGCHNFRCGLLCGEPRKGSRHVYATGVETWSLGNLSEKSVGEVGQPVDAAVQDNPTGLA